MQEDKVLSGYKEISAFLGVSTKTIQRHRKFIPVTRIGGGIFILESDLTRWLKKNSNKLPFKKFKTL